MDLLILTVIFRHVNKFRMKRRKNEKNEYRVLHVTKMKNRPSEKGRTVQRCESGNQNSSSFSM